MATDRPEDEPQELEVISKSSRTHLPTDSTSIRSRVSPVVKFVGFGLLLNALLWFFGLFVQIRGWIDLRASYVVLGIMWGIGTLICLGAAAQSRIRHRIGSTIFGSLLWAAALVGLNRVAPKPHTEQSPVVVVIAPSPVQPTTTVPLPKKDRSQKASPSPNSETPIDMIGLWYPEGDLVMQNRSTTRGVYVLDLSGSLDDPTTQWSVPLLFDVGQLGLTCLDFLSQS